MNELVEQF